MDFVVGAWLNRKYTQLPSSFILGAILAVALGAAILPNTVRAGDWVGVSLLTIFILLQTLFYPLSRETYYRIAQPLRRGIGGWIVPLPFVLIGWAMKLLIYFMLWVFALPIGIAGFFHLATTERNGQGWRPAQ